MADPRIENHALGLELQLGELVDQLEWAQDQGRDSDADRLRAEIVELQAELAATADKRATSWPLWSNAAIFRAI
ncbi:MAG: hypothetical protein JWO37_3757 [Acidimicrobiales bacterium]|jgi:hypothetical protein|nr:hypothetical protein [Acidimicrobiales bacterium]